VEVARTVERESLNGARQTAPLRATRQLNREPPEDKRMRSRKETLQEAMEEILHELEGPDAELLLESVVAGCAVIAYADDKVAPKERERMLGLIGRFEPLRVFHRGDLIDSFERASLEFEESRADAERKALLVIGQLRGRSRYAAMLMQVCVAIAWSDGRYDERERQAMIRICRSMNLNPDDFGLQGAPPGSRRIKG
jgi:tellurite resistance protein TerB